MYDKTKNGEGVLNDFDLAHVRGTKRPSGTERTGTMPFMALDLLTRQGMSNDCTAMIASHLRGFYCGFALDTIKARKSSVPPSKISSLPTLSNVTRRNTRAAK